MASFVQIGDVAFNPEHVVAVEFYDDHITVYQTDAVPLFFKGKNDCEHFMRWWQEEADVRMME